MQFNELVVGANHREVIQPLCEKEYILGISYRHVTMSCFGRLRKMEYCPLAYFAFSPEQNVSDDISDNLHIECKDNQFKRGIQTEYCAFCLNGVHKLRKEFDAIVFICYCDTHTHTHTHTYIYIYIHNTALSHITCIKLYFQYNWKTFQIQVLYISKMDKPVFSYIDFK
jgi:hypothetical protein